jgi:hypothetical protein
MLLQYAQAANECLGYAKVNFPHYLFKIGIEIRIEDRALALVIMATLALGAYVLNKKMDNEFRKNPYLREIVKLT